MTESAKRVEEAVQKFLSGYACSQAILAAFGGDWGLDELTAAKLGAGFGGGLGRLGFACGAVTGAVASLEWLSATGKARIRPTGRGYTWPCRNSVAGFPPDTGVWIVGV